MTPVAILSEVDDATLDVYRAVNRRPELRTPPPERLFHCVSELPEGGLRVFDVWASEEAFRRYDRDVLAPAVVATTGGRIGPPLRQILPVAAMHGRELEIGPPAS